jgi:hypothetical protein
MRGDIAVTEKLRRECFCSLRVPSPETTLFLAILRNSERKLMVEQGPLDRK